jgi:hypothetical protein
MVVNASEKLPQIVNAGDFFFCAKLQITNQRRTRLHFSEDKTENNFMLLFGRFDIDDVSSDSKIPTKTRVKERLKPSRFPGRKNAAVPIDHVNDQLIQHMPLSQCDADVATAKFQNSIDFFANFTGNFNTGHGVVGHQRVKCRLIENDTESLVRNARHLQDSTSHFRSA